MTKPRIGSRKGAWVDGLLVVVIAFNLINAVMYRLIEPIDETKALAYLALAVAFTSCLIAKRRP